MAGQASQEKVRMEFSESEFGLRARGRSYRRVGPVGPDVGSRSGNADPWLCSTGASGIVALGARVLASTTSGYGAERVWVKRRV